MQADLETQLREHQECLKSVLHNLSELKQIGVSEADLNSLVSDFLVASGGRGADIFFAEDPMEAMRLAASTSVEIELAAITSKTSKPKTSPDQDV